MVRQLSLISSMKGFIKRPKRTKNEIFLEKMEKLIPWKLVCEVILPYYPREGKGRRPIGLERMLRMYLVSQWFNLSDMACEEAVYDIAVFREFCHFDIGDEGVPDATTLENFRRMLEEYKLGEEIFRFLGGLLERNGLRCSMGAIVDATIIAAPSSTKNGGKKRDSEMGSTHKGGIGILG